MRLRHVPRTEAMAAIASVAVSLALLGIKFLAYFLTGSTAIFSDALESIVNVAASSVALYSLMLAHQPADREHPYGHGKVEFLSGGFEGGMILLASLVILARAVEAIVRGPVVQRLEAGLMLTALAAVVNVAMGLLLLRLGRSRSSMALEADGQHLLTDAITSAAVLVGLFIVRFSGWVYADPLTAIVVAMFIAGMGLRLLRRSTAGLMDEQDVEDERVLREILDAHVGPDGREPRICSYHKLRHRHSGRYHWIDFHIIVPAQWDVDHGHQVASAIEYVIEQKLAPANATAHVEPCAAPQCPNCRG